MVRRIPTRDRKLIHIRVYESTAKRLRVRAAEKDMTVQEFVEDLIEGALQAARAKS